MGIAREKGIAFAVAAVAALSVGNARADEGRTMNLAPAAENGVAMRAEDGGTMNLAPGKEIAVAMSDSELGRQRGGFNGLAIGFSFLIIVDSLGSTATGSGPLPTTGTLPQNGGTYNIGQGTITLDSIAGSIGNNNSGFFNMTTVNGANLSVVLNTTLSITFINSGGATALPPLNTIFPAVQ